MTDEVLTPERILDAAEDLLRRHVIAGKFTEWLTVFALKDGNLI